LSPGIKLQKKNVKKIIKKVWVQNVPSTVRLGSFLFHKPRVNNTQSEVLMALHIKATNFWDMTLYSLVDVGSLRVNWYLAEVRSIRFEHNGSIYL
jgi:hypothetical protein